MKKNISYRLSFGWITAAVLLGASCASKQIILPVSEANLECCASPEIKKEKIDPFCEERIQLIRDAETAIEEAAGSFAKLTWMGNDGSMPYLLFSPAAAANTSYPLIVVFDGSTKEEESDHEPNSAAPEADWRLFFCTKEVQKNNPCFVFVPQVSTGNVLSAEMACELINDLCDCLPIDSNRIYAIALAGGAEAFFDVLKRNDFLFSAAVLIGGSNPRLAALSVKTPFWIFHGGSDTIMPADFAMEFAKMFVSNGNKAFYTEYKGIGSEIYKWALTNRELLKWIFEQSLE